MKIIVTGTGGLVGSSLIEKLMGNHEVYSIGRSNPGLGDKIKFIPVDFSSNWDFSLLPENADAIFHLAQSEHFREFPGKASDVFKVNTESTVRLLDYALHAGVKKFIYASSGGIYGNSNKGFEENEPIIANRDLGFYLGTKLCSEILIENYTSLFDVITLRLFFVYGPKQKKGMLIPRLVDSVKSGIPIHLDGQDGIKINPIYVDDAALAISQSLNLKGSHKINVGGPEVLSLREICEVIGKKLHCAPKFVINEKAPKNLIGDINRMSKLLATPKIHFKDGVENLLKA